MTYQIDGGNVKDPLSFTWEERHSPFKDANGLMIVSAYRTALASFPAMTTAEFNAWITKCDEGLHSVKVSAPTSTTETTYTNCIIEHVAGDISTGLRYYNAEFRIRHLSTVTFLAFGAI